MKSQKGFSILKIIVTLGLLLVVGYGAVYAYNLYKKNSDKNAFESGKSLLDEKVDDVKNKVNEQTGKTTDDIKNQAVDTTKNSVNNFLDNLKK